MAWESYEDEDQYCPGCGGRWCKCEDETDNEIDENSENEEEE